MVKESSSCRVCMKKTKDSIQLESIFLRKPRTTYLEGYNICTQLNALLDDGLPKYICTHCKDELKTAFKFMEKAKETDKKLREKLGVQHRITRSSKRTGEEENTNQKVQQQDETIFEEIKTEFINCTKDPLEDSDVEAGEKSEDEIEMSWVDGGSGGAATSAGNIMDTNRFPEEKTAININDDEDDDDDKPLKELIKREKLKSIPEESSKTNENFDSSDVFNDFPEPDNYSSDDEATFNDNIVEHVSNPPTTAEAQIFPLGRYLCKICQKTYFTAAGLKAHIAVHMPKKKKPKRFRGPNKKKGKNKKKTTDDEDEDPEGEENKGEDDGECKKIDESIKKDDSTATKVDDSTTAEATTAPDAKKKRKNKTPKPKKMFPCHVCGKHMISASKLRYHMVMHTGEKDYLCTMCPKAYSTIYALKHHMRTHTGERPYECKFCGDKFTRPTTLKSHMRRHTGERPYGCDICGKRFIQHSSMTTHMKLNHMAKTIACPHCDKKYARQTDLNTHLLSHTGDKPFSCELCPSRFIRQANLNKHMNQHHSAKREAATAAAAASGTTTTTPKQISVQLQRVMNASSPTNNQIAEQSMQHQTQQRHRTINIPSINIPSNINMQQQSQENSLRLTNVRSLAKTVTAPTPPGSAGNDESSGSSHSNHILAQQQSHIQHSSHMGSSHSTRTENIPMRMSIPPGLPAHNMLAGLAAHGRLESVEHLKEVHPPVVDNLTHLLGEVIDPERIGRPVDDIMRWNWPNAS